MAPGDLVVCVNAGVIEGAGNDAGWLALLTEGSMYEVADICRIPKWEPAFGVKVRSISLGWHHWYHADRFRPCRKTNIDSLSALTRVREDAA